MDFRAVVYLREKRGLPCKHSHTDPILKIRCWRAGRPYNHDGSRRPETAKYCPQAIFLLSFSSELFCRVRSSLESLGRLWTGSGQLGVARGPGGSWANLGSRGRSGHFWAPLGIPFPPIPAAGCPGWSRGGRGEGCRGKGAKNPRAMVKSPKPSTQSVVVVSGGAWQRRPVAPPPGALWVRGLAGFPGWALGRSAREDSRAASYVVIRSVYGGGNKQCRILL
jgi:hypothetical protein